MVTLFFKTTDSTINWYQGNRVSWTLSRPCGPCPLQFAQQKPMSSTTRCTLTHNMANSSFLTVLFWGKGLTCSLYSLSWSPKSSNWTDMIRREEALQQHAMHCFVLIQLLFELWRLDIKCNRWIWPSPRNEVLKVVDCGLIQSTIVTMCGHRSFPLGPCSYNWPNVLLAHE